MRRTGDQGRSQSPFPTENCTRTAPGMCGSRSGGLDYSSPSVLLNLSLEESIELAVRRRLLMRERQRGKAYLYWLPQTTRLWTKPTRTIH
jgi:hypothetical protein